ncbi:unnamed protein product [Linum trigynum]|uniref:Uncharacterized protein n=1 Tax=Linum trigynum TaxID=586398 RepID=A0AAV2FE44_9ROSI
MDWWPCLSKNLLCPKFQQVINHSSCPSALSCEDKVINGVLEGNFGVSDANRETWTDDHVVALDVVSLWALF